jgi:uncharacterized protein YhfF
LTSPDTAHLPSFQFGGGGKLADELAALVLQGLKTATCTTLDEYREKNWPIPQSGDRSVMTDSRGAQLAVLETISAIIQPAGSVDAGFAFDEGEGDRTLASWRANHESYFSTQGRRLTDDTLLVCERFKIVQRLPFTPAPAHPQPAAPRP